MIITLAGGLGLTESLGRIYRAFKLLKHEVRYIPTRKLYLEKQDFCKPVLEACNGSECLLFWNPKMELPANLIHEASKITKTIYWNIDAPHFYIQNKPDWVSEFSAIFTCAVSEKQTFMDLGKPTFVFYPPVDPFVHTYIPVKQFECGFSIVATNCYTKATFPEMFFDRRELARAIEQKFRGQLRLYGFWANQGWGGVNGCPELVHSYRGFVKQEDLAPIYSSTKINLNTHGLTQQKGYLNERNFEILGCRGFMMVDRIAGIEEIFTDKKHCVMYDSLEDLLDKAEWYFSHDEERQRIAYEGSVYVHSRFNSLEWVRSLERIVREEL